MTIEELRVLITAQTNQLQQQVSGVRRQLTGLDQHTQRTCKSMSKAFSAIKLTAIIGGLTLLVKKTTEVASNLQEVQNVVDTTFGNMSYKVEEFAKTAVKQFGLSELSAKRAASTFMAMSNAIGVRQDYGADMSITLAGLAGDLASFWNTTSEQAETALKSIYTGETESLKQYGIVMTEAALQSYALSQGIKTQVSELSQAEKVILRYNYVLSATKDAQGDFLKTNDSWANQIRILKEQFSQLLGIIGKGFIAALTPVVKALNELLTKVIQVANAISEALGNAFGIDYSKIEVDTSGVESGLGNITDDAEDATGAVEELQKQLGLLSFDEINQLPQQNSNKESGSNNVSIGLTPNIIENQFSIADRLEDETPKIQGVLDNWSKMFKNWSDNLPKIEFKFNTELFKSNFQEIGKYALGVIGNMTENILSSFINLFNQIDFNHLARNVEKVTIDILAILDALVFGVTAIFDRIIEDIQFGQMLNGLTDLVVSTTNFIYESVMALIPAFLQWYDIGLSPIVEWFGSTIIDAIDFFVKELDKWSEWINQNSEGIKNFGTALGELTEGFWTLIEPLSSAVWSNFKDVLSGLFEVLKQLGDYVLNELIPQFQEVILQFTEESGPLINSLVSEFNELIEELTPLLELLGQIITEIIIPIIGTDLVTNFNLALDVIQMVINVVAELIQAFKGFIQFVTGIFTGDLQMAFEGLQNLVQGIFGNMVATVQGFIDMIETKIRGLADTIRTAINGLGSIMGMGDVIPSVNARMSYSIEPTGLPELANGGVIYSETIAKVGEYPGAKSNPEIVTPQNILKETMEVANASVVNAVMAMGNKVTKAIEDKNTDLYVDSTKLTKKVMDKQKEISNKKGNALIVTG